MIPLQLNATHPRVIWCEVVSRPLLLARCGRSREKEDTEEDFLLRGDGGTEASAALLCASAGKFDTRTH